MAKQKILLTMPTKAWGILEETLEMDADSSANDMQVRRDVRRSLNQVTQIDGNLKGLKQKIERIVNFYLPDEARHFEESDEPKNHIFHDLTALQQFADRL